MYYFILFNQYYTRSLAVEFDDGYYILQEGEGDVL